MIFKNFRLNIINRILFLMASIFLLVWLLQNTDLNFTIMIVGGALLLQIFSLIHYVERSNRDITRFLDSIRYSDFTQSFSPKGLGSSYSALSKAFTEVISEFQKIRAEKEEHYRYLKTVIQHVGVGLLAYDSEGNVELINNAAKRLFDVTHLKNIKKLKIISDRLVETLLNIKVAEKALEKVFNQNSILQLTIYATQFKLKNKTITLVSIQNIQSELEENELEAWQKLIRVLTHEILNSMTPIVSLSATAKDLLDESNRESINDAQNAIETINKRSSGLLHFVEAFRRMYKVPQPDFKIFPVSDLVERSFTLMGHDFKLNDIHFNYKIIPQKLELTADPNLLEQVLLNLYNNAIHALRNKKNREIQVNVELNKRGRVEIKVSDNGSGIKPESIDKIFIPFFTTKNEGSGIGLSLSKQIIRLHKGSITVISEPEVKTTFVITV